MLTLWTVARAQIRLALAYMMIRKSLIAAVVIVMLTGLCVIANGLPAIRVSEADGAAGGEPRVSVMFFGAAFGDLATGTVGLCTAFFIVCLYGFLSAFRVWRDASPRQRGYHWTLPVERSRHDLIRVAAGGVPLTGMAVILALVAAIGMAIGGHAGTLRMVPASFWIAFLVAPLCLYLLSTIAVLRSDRPGLPIVIALGSLYGLFILSLVPGAGVVFRILRFLVVGPYSLTVALAGPAIAIIRNGLPADQALRLAESGPGIDAWPAALILWFALALAGVIVAACIRPRAS